METKRVTDIQGLCYLWKVDNLYLAGQPSAESWKAISELGLKKIINIRGTSEMDFYADKEAVAGLDMGYEHIPVMVDGVLDATACERISALVSKTDLEFIHCGSANRVGAWLITYLVKHRGLEFEAAVKIASENGLTNQAFIAQAQGVLDLV